MLLLEHPIGAVAGISVGVVVHHGVWHGVHGGVGVVGVVHCGLGGLVSVGLAREGDRDLIGRVVGGHGGDVHVLRMGHSSCVAHSLGRDHGRGTVVMVWEMRDDWCRSCELWGGCCGRILMCLCWGRLWRLELCRLYMLLGLDRLLGLNRRVLGLNRCESGEYVWESRDHGSDCRLGADIVILSRCELSEKLTVPFGHSSGSIDTDQVGIARVDLQDYTSLGPAVGMGTSLGLVLDVDVVARLEGREELGALGQLLLLEHPPLGVCQLTLVSS